MLDKERTIAQLSTDLAETSAQRDWFRGECTRLDTLVGTLYDHFQTLHQRFREVQSRVIASVFSASVSIDPTHLEPLVATTLFHFDIERIQSAISGLQIATRMLSGVHFLGEDPEPQPQP